MICRQSLGFDLVFTIPNQGSFGTDDPPNCVPRRTETVCTPASPIGKTDILRHPKNCNSRGPAGIPRVLRDPFLAKYGFHVFPNDKAGCGQTWGGHLCHETVAQ